MRSKMDIMNLIDEEDVEFIRLQFTDILGNLKNIAITPNQLERESGDMYPIKAGALFGDDYNYPGVLYLHPDYETFEILPWRPQQEKVAKLVCDVCGKNGENIELSPRKILKNVLKEAENDGYSFLASISVLLIANVVIHRKKVISIFAIPFNMVIHLFQYMSVLENSMSQ